MLLEISLELLKDVGAFAGCIVAIGGAVGLIWGFVKKPFNKLNNRFEALKTQLDNNKQELMTAIKDGDIATWTSVLRVELNQLIELEPDNEDTIYKIYDEYKRLSGNHYMDAKIKRWEAKQLEKKLAKEESKE